MVDDFCRVIGSLGFPIAISVYLLLHFQKTIDSLKDVIRKNTEVINDLKDKL